MRPTPEEALHRARAAPVADPLQSGRIVTGTETVVQGGVADPGLHALPLGPLVTVQPDPDRIRRIRIGLPERPAPFRIPQVEVEVVDERHLPAPLHVRMRGVFLSLRLPRSPHRRLLLRDPDQCHCALTAAGRGGVDVRAGDRFLVLTLPEVDHRHAMVFRPAVHLGDVGVTDLPERRRRRDYKPPLPTQELTHPAHGLQLRHVRLQEDPVDRPASERDVIPQ